MRSALSFAKATGKQTPCTTNDLYDWHKRMSWWQRVWERWDGALPEHHAAYGRAIADYMTGTGMNQADVDEWRRLFDQLVTWPE